MPGWCLDDIPWNEFDPDRVAPEMVALVKAASMVEANAADYRDYLSEIFADDPRFCRSVDTWAVEEEQHGAALARWAAMADPEFDFDRAFAAFREGFRIPLGLNESVRGSRAGEMIARCMVETGTNSFYTALATAADEPVLKQICRNIAADERAHYWMFHRCMTRYMAHEKLDLWSRLRVALGRVAETDDDELAYAWFAANGRGEPYDRRRHGGAYHRTAMAYYSPEIVRGAVAMLFDAVGLTHDGLLRRWATLMARGVLRIRTYWLARSLPA